MRRRHFLAGMSALAAPSIVQAQNSRVLRYVSSAGPVQLDPLATTVYTTLVLGLQIFESLYSVDEHLLPRPQMAAGHTIEDDGKRWVIRLRDGLRFHDGEPVLARDCVASINRWMKRDAPAKTLASRLDALEAPDDRTVVFPPQAAVSATAVRSGQGVAEFAGHHAGAPRGDRPEPASSRIDRQRSVPLRRERVLGQQPRGTGAI